MRNTAQHPVTKEEKLAALDWALAAWQREQRVGGITGAALQEARRDIERGA